MSDSATDNFIKNNSMPSSKLKVDLTAGDAYSVLKNHIIEYILSKKIDLVTEINNNVSELNYTIENTSCKYSDIFRDGFLGPFMVRRELSLKGLYLYNSSPNSGSIHPFDFNYYYTDSVKVDDIKTLENISYKFTSAALPPEPFFTGLFEPVAALGTAAAAVILFFTVRSK
jgi:hypothetical protein